MACKDERKAGAEKRGKGDPLTIAICSVTLNLTKGGWVTGVGYRMSGRRRKRGEKGIT